VCGEYHKSRSLGHVAQKLGHGNWENKQVHITLEEVYLAQIADEFCTKAAKTADEARRLFEEGWEHAHCEFDAMKILRKHK